MMLYKAGCVKWVHHWHSSTEREVELTLVYLGSPTERELLRCGTMPAKHVSRSSKEVAKYADTVSESLRKLDSLKILNLT